MPARLLFCLLAILSPTLAHSAEAAREPAETTEVKSDEPENAIGVPGADGRLDYGSPNLPQTLANDRVFIVKYFSRDREYGYVPEKPIMVGGGIEGPKNEQRFLNALAGPNGEPVSYTRIGSGHRIITRNGLFGDDNGLLDMYEVTYEGAEAPVTLHLNMYDSDTLKIPVGFRMKYAPGLSPPPADEIK